MYIVNKLLFSEIKLALLRFFYIENNDINGNDNNNKILTIMVHSNYLNNNYEK